MFEKFDVVVEHFDDLVRRPSILFGAASETLAARGALLRYDYPGNVRELENIIERAVVLTRDDVIGEADLPLSTQGLEEAEGGQASLPAAVEGVERRMIREALARAGGVQTRRPTENSQQRNHQRRFS